MDINYKKDPKIFSNTAFISYSYFELLEDVLNYSIPIVPETIVGLSILSEAVVLHKEWVMSNSELYCNRSEKGLIRKFVKSGVLKYEDEWDVFSPKEYSAAEMMNNELSLYRSGRGISHQDVSQVEIYRSREDDHMPVEDNWSSLRRLFGNAVDDVFLQKLNSLSDM